MSEHQKLVTLCARIIYDGFERYNIKFERMTDRARRRFERRDWRGHQRDIVYRVDMYEKAVREAVTTLQRTLGPRATDHALWQEIRLSYGQRVENVPDAGFMKTYFNSTSRRIFGTVGVDPEVEFVSPAADEGYSAADALRLRRYPYWDSLQDVFARVLADFRFRVPYQDAARDAERIAAEVAQHTRIVLQEYGEFHRFEFIDCMFFQSARAYLVGRILQPHHVSPIVIALENADGGIRVDATLLAEEEVSIVFSYTRSYYFADPNSVIGAVHFLHSILPRKPIDELYTVMGRLRQGKTERYRVFTNHLYGTDHKFEHAAGDKGLVMIVFNLPSYDLVFKVIRERFGYPKTISRENVIDKYKLVSKHDRAGRLIDTQEFLNLEFPANRFAPELLDELAREAANTVRLVGDKLRLGHVYIERRVRPLNLYIREANRAAQEAAILDYGQAIKDLAQTNIFPGDLLLKNFGVTRHGRVVFYDYDEVMLVTECNFRDMPQSRDDDDEMRADSWFYVDSHDIFPEEFVKFLSMDAGLRELFLEVHGELLTADYWRKVRDARLAGEIALVVPYMRPALPVGRRRGKLSA